jgi:ribosomal protein S18 acetylase RimI-like enzyme
MPRIKTFMIIRKFKPTDKKSLIPLVIDFRRHLANLKGKKSSVNAENANNEITYYTSKNHPVFIALDKNEIVGYCVGKIEDKTVWAESLFVKPEYRKKGIGRKLYKKIEMIADKLSSETVYNWIHPNNKKIISFLKKQGYSVLNLIEIRKQRKNENCKDKIKIIDTDFKY